MDRAAFYDVMRSKFGSLSQKQVDGTEILLNEGEKRKLPMNQLSYILSTSWHETAATMQPIAEYGHGAGLAYLTYYDSSKTTKCKYKPQEAYGRGYVQLTWEANYERADKECKLNGALVKNFEMAMDAAIASEIIFTGMGQGWFTGKKLTDYVNDAKTDYVNARRVVNGTDKADLLAGYAKSFEEALRAAGYHLPPEEVPVEPVDPDEVTNPPDEVEHPPQPPEVTDHWFQYEITTMDGQVLQGQAKSLRTWV